MTIFVKVADASSFAAAARHFGMSAAMVSKHVQTLEEHLGALVNWRIIEGTINEKEAIGGMVVLEY